MGRKPGSKNRPKTDEEGGLTGKPNNAPLTDEQLQSLFFEHKRAYEKSLTAFKAAQADLKNTGKLIKAEGGSVAEVKIAIALESDGGNEKMQQRIERELRVAKWMGAPVGTQFSLLDEDRTPSIDKATDDGKRAGLKGENCTPPNHMGDQQQQAWIDGWHAGQKVLADRIAQKHGQERAQDAEDFERTA